MLKKQLKNVRFFVKTDWTESLLSQNGSVCVGLVWKFVKLILEWLIFCRRWRSEWCSYIWTFLIKHWKIHLLKLFPQMASWNENEYCIYLYSVILRVIWGCYVFRLYYYQLVTLKLLFYSIPSTCTICTWKTQSAHRCKMVLPAMQRGNVSVVQ